MKNILALLLLLATGLPAAPLQLVTLDLLASGVPRLNVTVEGPGPQNLSDSQTGRFGVTSEGSGVITPGRFHLRAASTIPGGLGNASGWSYVFGYTEGLVTFDCAASNCGATTMVTLNVHFSGVTTISGSGAGAEVWLYPTLDGLSLTESRISTADERTGIFADRTSLSFSDEVLTLPAFEVPLGVPVFLSIQAGVAGYVNGSSAASAVLDFTNTIQFAAQPFNVAPGITVNAPDFYIVNNEFTAFSTAVPEPGTGMLALGAGLFAWWRRRHRRA